MKPEKALMNLVKIIEGNKKAEQLLSFLKVYLEDEIRSRSVHLGEVCLHLQ